MTEAQTRIKPGDLIQLKDQPRHEAVIITTDLGVLSVSATNGGVVKFWAWNNVALPEPPKAIPGQRYRKAHRRDIGRVDGRIYAWLEDTLDDLTGWEPHPWSD